MIVDDRVKEVDELADDNFEIEVIVRKALDCFAHGRVYVSSSNNDRAKTDNEAQMFLENLVGLGINYQSMHNFYRQMICKYEVQKAKRE